MRFQLEKIKDGRKDLQSAWNGGKLSGYGEAFVGLVTGGACDGSRGKDRRGYVALSAQYLQEDGTSSGTYRGDDRGK
jgi:hypothetical protein